MYRLKTIKMPKSLKHFLIESRHFKFNITHKGIFCKIRILPTSYCIVCFLKCYRKQAVNRCLTSGCNSTSRPVRQAAPTTAARRAVFHCTWETESCTTELAWGLLPLLSHTPEYSTGIFSCEEENDTAWCVAICLLWKASQHRLHCTFRLRDLELTCSRLRKHCELYPDPEI